MMRRSEKCSPSSYGYVSLSVLPAEQQAWHPGVVAYGRARLPQLAPAVRGQTSSGRMQNLSSGIAMHLVEAKLASFGEILRSHVQPSPYDPGAHFQPLPPCMD